MRQSYAAESVRIGSFRPLFSESLPESFRMSCFCGQTRTSLAEALACSTRLQGAGGPTNTKMVGVRSVSAREGTRSVGELSGKSWLDGPSSGAGGRTGPGSGSSNRPRPAADSPLRRPAAPEPRGAPAAAHETANGAGSLLAWGANRRRRAEYGAAAVSGISGPAHQISRARPEVHGLHSRGAASRVPRSTSPGAPGP